jgi:pimeloyl-ACP methyl ester carboxylesterase
MAVSEQLGEPRTVAVPAGRIAYRERGTGPPLVFVHGVGVNGDLWRAVAPAFADDHRCVVPDLPFGAHSHPLRADADMSLPGLARIVADFIEALELDDVVVVANDTGGAVAQWLMGHYVDRIAGLILTSCDAFEKFPPTPQLYLEPAARVPALLWCVAKAVQLRPIQRTPFAYGWAAGKPIDPRIMRSYTKPIGTNPRVRRDLRRLLLAVDTRYTHEAAEALRGFDKPALVVWAADDKLFPLEHGRRLAELLPQGRFETIQDSRTFIPEDQPERLVATARRFLTGRAPAAAPG